MPSRFGALVLGGWLLAACVGEPPQPCTTCSGACVSLKTDVANCGECGKACSAGQVCKEGSCTLSCAAGLTSCGAKCLDLKHDPTACGGCGTTCGTDEYCSDGTCAPVAACAASQTRCSGTCTNTASDQANCGSCGHACPSGQACTAGACATSCTAGLSSCALGDGGSTCANLQTDNGNCGVCGTTCGVGKACSAGSCQVTCGAGNTNCSGSCVSLQTDNANCGVCGTPCTNGKACVGGMCQVTCGAGITNCSGTCAALTADDSNCGACGVVCAPTAKCVSGSCLDSFAVPRLCSQLPADAGIPKDGGFVTRTVYAFGRLDTPLSVRCGGDGGTWLEVPADAGQNFARRSAGGFYTVGPEVVTRFSAVRIDYRFPNGLVMAPLDDYTFAPTTGMQTQGNSNNPSTYPITAMSYGAASGCVSGNNPTGTANITLTGIPLAVFNTAWASGGYLPAGGATFSNFGQVVNVTGGGFCGDVYPSEGLVRLTLCSAPGAEVCDRLDNNCDGVVDNLSDGGVCP